MRERKPELLAPAGSFETLTAAFDHGADAVYLGMGVLNLRAYSENFTTEDLPEIKEICDRFGGKFYVVLNLMPNEDQLQEIVNFLKELNLSKAKPDALIVSDPGVIRLCREHIPDIDLHLSTQTGTFNSSAMKFWADMGITRVVLPREFDLNEVEQSVNSEICEIELFVHGAMCVSISGRCLMGAWHNGRHPNHGECSQPCRLAYEVRPIDDRGEYVGETKFELRDGSEGTYIFNAKDLNTISILPSILKLGVHSLKIEGRNKSVHYVSTVVKAYRKAIDCYFNNEVLPDSIVEELALLDHRPYTTGFLGDDNSLQSTSYAKEKSRIRVLGRVKEVLEGGVAVVDIKNPFSCGEKVSILPVNSKNAPFDLTVKAIEDLSGHSYEKAQTNRVLKIYPLEDYRLRSGDMLRRIDKSE